VRPEDRLAWLLMGLDRLPGGARRLLAVLLPLLLLGLLVFSLMIAPRGGRHAQRSSSDGGRVPRAGAREVAAGGVARGFLEGYLAFSYGHGRISAIHDADRGLLGALEGQRVPAAARNRRPRIVALRVKQTAPGVAEAAAMVADGSGIRYPLVCYLERRSRGWLVTRLAD
jgi:hypothetical protein